LTHVQSPSLRNLVGVISIAASVVLSGCASALSDTVTVTTEASGSSQFRLGPPRAYKASNGLTLMGRVCRLARNTGLSPAHVRLEHIGADGTVKEAGRAYVPSITRAVDQPCSTYAGHVAWQLADGETVRVCFDRGKECPPPVVKTVVAAPAPSATPPESRP